MTNDTIKKLVVAGWIVSALLVGFHIAHWIPVAGAAESVDSGSIVLDADGVMTIHLTNAELSYFRLSDTTQGGSIPMGTRTVSVEVRIIPGSFSRLANTTVAPPAPPMRGSARLADTTN